MPPYFWIHGILDYAGKEKIWRPGGERLAPSVSVKDRPLSGLVIEFELY